MESWLERVTAATERNQGRNPLLCFCTHQTIPTPIIHCSFQFTVVFYASSELLVHVAVSHMNNKHRRPYKHTYTETQICSNFPFATPKASSSGTVVVVVPFILHLRPPTRLPTTDRGNLKCTHFIILGV